LAVSLALALALVAGLSGSGSADGGVVNIRGRVPRNVVQERGQLLLHMPECAGAFA
jgi:hypothetical protein